MASSDTLLFKESLERNKNSERIPHELVLRLVKGENPIRVWREYRKKTVQELAEQIGITVAYLSEIEDSKKKASQKILKLLSTCLCVDIEELVENSSLESVSA